MSLGQSFVGKVGAAVNWIKAIAIIRLDYNSKNKPLTETISLVEAFARTVNKVIGDPADTITAADAPSIQPTKPIADTQSLSDSFAQAIGINIAEIVGASDLVPIITGGAINGSGFNTRAINGGDIDQMVTNITIT